MKTTGVYNSQCIVATIKYWQTKAGYAAHPTAGDTPSIRLPHRTTQPFRMINCDYHICTHARPGVRGIKSEYHFFNMG